MDLTPTDASGVHARGRLYAPWNSIASTASSLVAEARRRDATTLAVWPRTGLDLVVALTAARQGSLDLMLRPTPRPHESRGCSTEANALDIALAGASMHVVLLELPLPRDHETNVYVTTSGTTGAPKQVAWKLQALDRGAPRPGGQRGERWIIGYEPGSFAALVATCEALRRASDIEFVTPYEIGIALQKAADVAVGTPSFWRVALLAQGSEAVAAVRTISVGGEPVATSLLRNVRRRYSPTRLVHIFGATEVGTLPPIDDERGGIPRAWLRHRLSNGTSIDIRDGRLLMSRAVGAKFEETGDTVHVDGDRIYIRDREHGIVNVGGIKVDTDHVKSTLESHELVLAVRVFGIRNGLVGNVLVASVVPAPGSPRDLTQRLRRFATEMLTPHEVPRRIDIVDSIELRPTGKSWQPHE